jgi:hypothetical protein
MNYFLKKFYGVFALFALSICIVAILNFVIWINYPNLINSLGLSIKSSYVEYKSETFYEAKAILHNHKDKKVPISKFISFINENHKVKEKDTLGRKIDESYKIVVEQLVALKEYKDALIWVNKWIEFYRNNIDAWAAKVEILFTLNQDKEAFAVLNDWNRKLPESHQILRVYLDNLDIKSDKLLALEMIDNYLKHNNHSKNEILNNWEIFWRYKAPFSSKFKKRLQNVVINDDVLEFTMSFPKGVNEIRFDPPVLDFSLCLKNPEVTLLSNNYKKVISGYGFNIVNTTPTIEWNRSTIKINPDDDPHFTWKLASDENTSDFELIFRSKIEKCHPSWLHEPFSYGDLISIKKQLPDQKSLVDTVSKLMDLKSNSLMDYIKKIDTLTFELFWKKTNKDQFNRHKRTGLNLKIGGEMHPLIDVTIPTYIDSNYLRLDLPSIDGLVFNNYEISLNSDTDIYKLEIEDLEFIDINSYNGRIMIVGPDPRIIINKDVKIDIKKIKSVNFNAKIDYDIK